MARRWLTWVRVCLRRRLYCWEHRGLVTVWMLYLVFVRLAGSGGSVSGVWGARSLLAPVTCADRRLTVIRNDDQPCLPVLLCLIFVRLCGWLAVAGRFTASKDRRRAR